MNPMTSAKSRAHLAQHKALSFARARAQVARERAAAARAAQATESWWLNYPQFYDLRRQHQQRMELSGTKPATTVRVIEQEW